MLESVVGRYFMYAWSPNRMVKTTIAPDGRYIVTWTNGHGEVVAGRWVGPDELPPELIAEIVQKVPMTELPSAFRRWSIPCSAGGKK